MNANLCSGFQMKPVKLQLVGASPRELAFVDEGGTVAFTVVLRAFPGCVTARWGAGDRFPRGSPPSPGGAPWVGGGRLGDARESAGVGARTTVCPL